MIAEEELRLVYDLKLRRPGCAILQIGLGGSPGVATQFPSEDWLVHLTPDLKCYKISKEELAKVIRYHNEKGR